MKHIVTIADSNGAGKAAFACEHLPREANCSDFNQMIESATRETRE